MKLETYVRILLNHWWIILLAFLVTIAFTVLLTLGQAPIFSAVSTFVVSPSNTSLDARGVLSGLDVLSNKSQIANTYAEIATSDLIEQEAVAALNLDPTQAKSFAVKTKLRGATSVLEIAVEGGDPALIADFANKIGERTVAYVEQISEVYNLKVLDPAKPPDTPIRPNKLLNLILGSIFGLALGVGLAFLVDHLRRSIATARQVSVLDHESGACNRQYFAYRLKEEMSRTRRRKYALSLALLDVDLGRVMQKTVPSEFQVDALQGVTNFVKQSLREEDVLARLQGTTFGLLLPDMPEEEAQAVLEKLQIKMRGKSFEIERCGVKLNLQSAAGLAAYNCNDTRRTDLLANAKRALKRAKAEGTAGSSPSRRMELSK